MADEKLPGYVESVLWDHREDCHAGTGSCGGCVTLSEREEAILRFAREREAAALERAADIAHHVAMERILNRPMVVASGGHVEALDAKASEALRIENAIRALIHKEPANG